MLAHCQYTVRYAVQGGGKKKCFYIDLTLKRNSWKVVHCSEIILYFSFFHMSPFEEIIYKYSKQYYKFLSNFKAAGDPTGCVIPMYFTPLVNQNQILHCVNSAQTSGRLNSHSEALIFGSWLWDVVECFCYYL